LAKDVFGAKGVNVFVGENFTPANPTRRNPYCQMTRICVERDKPEIKRKNKRENG